MLRSQPYVFVVVSLDILRKIGDLTRNIAEFVFNVDLAHLTYEARGILVVRILTHVFLYLRDGTHGLTVKEPDKEGQRKNEQHRRRSDEREHLRSQSPVKRREIADEAEDKSVVVIEHRIISDVPVALADAHVSELGNVIPVIQSFIYRTVFIALRRHDVSYKSVVFRPVRSVANDVSETSVSDVDDRKRLKVVIIPVIIDADRNVFILEPRVHRFFIFGKVVEIAVFGVLARLLQISVFKLRVYGAEPLVFPVDIDLYFVEMIFVILEQIRRGTVFGKALLHGLHVASEKLALSLRISLVQTAREHDTAEYLKQKHNDRNDDGDLKRYFFPHSIFPRSYHQKRRHDQSAAHEIVYKFNYMKKIFYPL